jgi:hypothetical protein
LEKPENMDTAVLTAIVSAVVSLTVTLITVFVSRSSIKAEREKLERELQRSMTARLYDARLESYPRAMEVTEGLRKSRLVEQPDRVSQAYFRNILEELNQWHATKAPLLSPGVPWNSSGICASSCDRNPPPTAGIRPSSSKNSGCQGKLPQVLVERYATAL